MGGKDVECRRLLQELCSAGEVQNRARGVRSCGAERCLGRNWYCTFVKRTVDLAGERKQLLQPSSWVGGKRTGILYSWCFTCRVRGKI